MNHSLHTPDIESLATDAVEHARNDPKFLMQFCQATIARLLELQNAPKTTMEVPVELQDAVQLVLQSPGLQALLAPPHPLTEEFQQLVAGTLVPIPPKYPRERSKNKPSPIDWLNEHYGKYIEANLLYSDDLRRIDSGLVQAIENYAKNRKQTPWLYIPRERERVNHIIKDLPQTIAEKIILVGNALAIRQHRKKQR